MKVKITSNIKRFKNMVNGVPDKIVIPSVVQALNRAGRDGKRAAIRRTVSVTGVSRSVIGGNKRLGNRARISGGTGRAKATRKNLSYALFVRTEKPVKISKAFGSRSLRRLSSLDRGSFFARMPDSGKASYWKRTGRPKTVPRKGRYAGSVIKTGPKAGRPITREPIEELTIPLHPHGTNAALDGFDMVSARVLPIEFQRSANKRLSKIARR